MLTQNKKFWELGSGSSHLAPEVLLTGATINSPLFYSVLYRIVLSKYVGIGYYILHGLSHAWLERGEFRCKIL
jgi:hypothetical protein